MCGGWERSGWPLTHVASVSGRTIEQWHGDEAVEKWGRRADKESDWQHWQARKGWNTGWRRHQGQNGREAGRADVPGSCSPAVLTTEFKDMLFQSIMLNDSCSERTNQNHAETNTTVKICILIQFLEGSRAWEMMSACLPSPVLKLRLLYWESASIKILFQTLMLTQAQVL